MARSTVSRVFLETPGRRLITRLTVASLTPARVATSVIPTFTVCRLP